MNINTSSRLLAIILFVVTVAWFVVDGESAGAQQRPAEQIYRNIQVFKGLPASQLYAAMNFISAALGVSCTHCHVPNQFEKDEKPAKQTARRMIQMTRTINQATFNRAQGEGRNDEGSDHRSPAATDQSPTISRISPSEQLTVTCYTCHRGKPNPVSMPPVTSAAAAADKSTEASPSAQELIDNHIAALGGKARLAKITTLVMKGQESASSETSPSGSRPLEIYRKAPNKLLKTNPQLNDRAVRAFDGTIGWQQFGGRTMGMSVTDLGMIKREAVFDRDFNIEGNYSRMDVIGKASIVGREVWVIEAAPIEAAIGPVPIELEKLYFDIETGLLTRRYVEMRTALGRIPMAIDFEDYRERKGVKWPFRIRTLLPGLSITQSFTEVLPNIPIDDDKFTRPKNPSPDPR